jgi:HPt (histidine-containing phosphotransfer) domain-containing protein
VAFITPDGKRMSISVPTAGRGQEANPGTVNAAEIRMLRSALGEDADRIIGLFLAETEARLQRMSNQRDSDQRDLLAREAHSLKSAAATFGCIGLAQLAMTIEEEAATLDLAELPERISGLMQASRAAQSALLDRSF